MVTYRSTPTRSTRRRQALKTKGERGPESKVPRSGNHAKSDIAPLPRRDSHFKINVNLTQLSTSMPPHVNSQHPQRPKITSYGPALWYAGVIWAW